MSKNSDALITFLAGVAAGAALGVLFAPESGKETREKLGFQLEKYKDKLQELLAELMEDHEKPKSGAKTEGEKVVNMTKDKAEKLLEDVEQLINQIKGRKQA